MQTAQSVASLWGNIGSALVPGHTKRLNQTTMELRQCGSEIPCTDTGMSQGVAVSLNRAPSSGVATFVGACTAWYITHAVMDRFQFGAAGQM